MPDPHASEFLNRLESLERSLDEHRDELRSVRDAIDELRDGIEWIARNPEPGSWRPLRDRRIVSMPLEPAADDFAERINALAPNDLPSHPDEDPVLQPQDEEGIAPGEPTCQQELF